MADASFLYSTFNQESGNKTVANIVSDKFISVGRKPGNLIRYLNTVPDFDATPAYTAVIPVAPTISSDPLVNDGATIVKDNTAATGVTVSLSKYRRTVYALSPVAAAINQGKSLPAEFDARIAQHINAVNSDIAALAVAGISTNEVGTFTQALTTANCALAVGKIAKLGYKPSVAVIDYGSTGWGALIDNEPFANSIFMGKNSPLTGQFGINSGWLGLDWVASPNVGVSSSNLTGFILSPETISVAVKTLGPIDGVECMGMYDPESKITFRVSKFFNPSDMTSIIAIETLMGYSVTKETTGCLLKH